MKDILRDLFFKNVTQTSQNSLAFEVSHTDGSFIYNSKGEKFYDLISGTSVNNLGHNNRIVIDAIKSQLDKYMHVMVYGEAIESPQVLLAKEITSLLPASLSSVYFVNSGSEAVEGAMKLAKRFTKRRKIISFANCYHGSTHGCLSLSSNPKYQKAFSPLLPDIEHITINNINDLEKIDQNTACVIAEPVQGEAGVIAMNKEYASLLRQKCSEQGALLIFDEIQTGMGRTGTMFAFEQLGVKPDILLLAKAFGGGMPLGAFISSNKISETLSYDPPLGHITTFGGHPVCCAAALAFLKVLKSDKTIEKVKEKENFIQEYFSKIDGVKQVRTAGLLAALEVESAEIAQSVVEQCVANGVITDWFLYNDCSIRLAPPLNIEIKDLEAAFDIIAKIISSLKNKK